MIHLTNFTKCDKANIVMVAVMIVRTFLSTSIDATEKKKMKETNKHQKLIQI